jgi:hypothetical protein
MSKMLRVCLAIACWGWTASAALSVQLLTNKPSPQPVGTPIGLGARVENAAQGMQVFRYSVSVDNGPFRIVRDFSQQREFAWTPALHEHQATVRVTVRINESKETAEGEAPFRVVSRLKGTAPTITATAHPLVPLFSAPACPADSQFRVAFHQDGEDVVARTSEQPCRASGSNNAYVAGMRAGVDYSLRSEVITGGTVKAGAWLPFRTALVDGDFPPVSVAIPHQSGGPVQEPLLIHVPVALNALKRPFATDMDGQLVWYSPWPQLLTRVLPGGRFLGQGDGPNSVNLIQRMQVLRETDVAGSTLRETNIGRVAEQLEKHGIRSDCRMGGKECVSSFHHEAIRLPNGHTLTIAALERMFPAGTQGSKEPVDIVGDLVIDLDEDFQVTAVWNAFDHVDINRAGKESSTCPVGPGGGGCPPIFLVPLAREWLHSNSLHYVAASGDFIVSMPEQSWVVKVDWKNGKGTGKLLWRLGEGGDFVAKSSDPHPWFSHQHDAGFDAGGDGTLSVFDNSGERNSKDPKANTRGQSWKLDEQARTATLVHNADLGVYSFAVGSAQRLKNGGYTFQAGFINPASPYTRAIETSPEGKVVYAQQVDGVIVYRSFRVAGMYSAPGK